MNTLRLSFFIGAALVGSATLASADPVLRPHDAATPAVHTAQAVAHEAPSAGVHHVRPVLATSALTHVAVLDRPMACDSLLCPGYTMMGVGF